MPWKRRPKGNKVSMCRCMGAVSVGQERVRDWHMRVLELQYYGIVTGSITAERYKQLLDSKHCAVSQKEVKDATMQTGDEELRKLRKLCDNTMMLATIFYSDEENWYRQCIISESCRSAQEWQGLNNQKAISVDDCLRAQIN